MTREQRIAHIKRTAPEDSYLKGFGGSTMAAETLVFYVHRAAPALGVRPPYSFEVRIPVRPKGFPVEQVEQEYGCVAIAEWNELNERISA